MFTVEDLNIMKQIINQAMIKGENAKIIANLLDKIDAEVTAKSKAKTKE